MLCRFPGLKSPVPHYLLMKTQYGPSAYTKSSPDLIMLNPGTKTIAFTQRLTQVVPSHGFQDCKRARTIARVDSGSVVAAICACVLWDNTVEDLKVSKTLMSLSLNSICQYFIFTMLDSQWIPYSVDSTHLRNPFSQVTQWLSGTTTAKCWAINLNNSFQMRYV